LNYIGRKVIEIACLIEIPNATPPVLYGYPPKELLIHDGSVLLAELGLRSGETLIVEKQSSPAGGGKIAHKLTGKQKSSPTLVRKLVISQ